jgi:nondiscriminating aspartyl-tRNA synthetase
MLYIKAKTTTNLEINKLKNHIGEHISLKGMVYKIRKMQGFSFIILSVKDQYIQCVLNNSILNAEMIVENASVSIVGNVVLDSRCKAGYEIQIEQIEILSLPKEEPPFSINNKQIKTSFDSLLNYRPLTMRNKKQKAIFKLQEGLGRGFRKFFWLNNFTEIHSPKIVQSGAEGGANIFELDYFGKKAYLAQSPQFYKQMMVGVYERVYEIAPVFRSEKHDTSRHLNEYTSVDIEMGFITDHREIMQLETSMLQYTMSFIKEEYSEQITELNVDIPVIGDIPCISFEKAKDILESKLNFAVNDYNDFEPKEEELISGYIKQETGSDFVFVEGYPASKRPFYTMDSEEAIPTALTYYLGAWR